MAEVMMGDPFVNEGGVVALLQERLEKLPNRPSAWELLFVSDGSTDGSVKFVEAWTRADPSVKLIILTRNFGHQNAVSAGLSFAPGKCVGRMDAHLQQQPEIPMDVYKQLVPDNVDVLSG